MNREYQSNDLDLKAIGDAETEGFIEKEQQYSTTPPSRITVDLFTVDKFTQSDSQKNPKILQSIVLHASEQITNGLNEGYPAFQDE